MTTSRTTSPLPASVELGRGKRITAWKVIAAVLVAVILSRPAQAVALGTRTAAPAGQRKSKTAQILGLLDEVTPAQWLSLRHVSAEQLARLAHWTELEITFDGPWTPEELTQVVTVLDAFGGTFGESRIVELLGTAIAEGSGGARRHLRILKTRGATMPAAVWRPEIGEIALVAAFFDDAFVAEHYYWQFLERSYVDRRPDVSMRQLIIGHELGHVLIDGLRVEITAAGEDAWALETRYREMIDAAQWPHVGYGLHENLATELSLWALGFGRTPEVDALRRVLMHYLPVDKALPE